ncbi:MAG TPA: hypothetical protein VHA34_19050, partial [Actinomycetes bacterium]|nr:hypothetical protein [Actinomycetes bacterium]
HGLGHATGWLRVRLTSLGPYSRNVCPALKVRVRQPLARCRVSWPDLTTVPRASSWAVMPEEYCECDD